MIDEYIQDVMTKKQIPGLSVAVVREGNPLLMKGYGIANLEHSVSATEKTVYEVASVGKTFTATVVMMLVEEGVIELDRAIAVCSGVVLPIHSGFAIAGFTQFNLLVSIFLIVATFVISLVQMILTLRHWHEFT